MKVTTTSTVIVLGNGLSGKYKPIISSENTPVFHDTKIKSKSKFIA